MTPPESALAEQLQKMAPDLEREIGQRLTGFMGAILRSYLPQTWVLQGKRSAASLTVDGQGKARVADRALPNPDVTIRATEEVLLSSLRGEGKAKSTDFEVSLSTGKGKTAFDFLRKRFGF